MGKEPHRVNDAAKDSSTREVEILEAEIGRSRKRLDAYVDELDRRRHRLLSVRKNPAVAIGTIFGAAVLAAGTVLVVRRRRRTLTRAGRKAEEIQAALGRMARHPERVASDRKSPWAKALIGIAPVLLKTLLNGAQRRRR